MQDEHQVSEYRVTAADLRRLGKSRDLHKHSYGHAVIVSRAPGQGRAARLVALGALRIGAGVVNVFNSPDGQGEHAVRLDVIMAKTYEAADRFAEYIRALGPSAICVGPNHGA